MDPIDQFSLPTVNGLGKANARGADEKSALRAFDAYFVGEMLRRSAPENPTGLMDGGQAGRMYQDHLYQELARIVTAKGDFGLSKVLEGHLDVQANESEEGDETAEGERVADRILPLREQSE